MPGTANRFLVRPAVPDDATALIAHVQAMAIEAAYWLPLQPGEFQVTVEQERELLARAALSDNELFLIAELDGRVVGVLNYSGGKRQANRHVATLGMSVRSHCQCRGIGSALLSEAIARAKGSGCVKRLDLLVYIDNDRAIRLYERHGFVREGIRRKAIRRGEDWVDDLQMALLF